MDLGTVSHSMQNRPSGFVSANKLLVDSIHLTYGPTHKVNYSSFWRKQYATILARPESPDATRILSDPFEFEDDPFVNNFNDEKLDDDLLDLNANNLLDTGEQPAISSFPECDRIPADELYLLQNQRPWKIFPREEGHENEEEWNGFNDYSSPPPDFNILPPPIESFESQDTALQAIQEWAREHGYALRIRSSRKRQKDDAHPFFVYLECDRGGRNISTLKANDKRLRKSSSRRRDCPFRCSIRQPRKEPDGLWTIQHSEAPHHTHNHGPSFFSTAHPIHRRNARKAKPELLKQIENNKIAQISARDTLSSLQAQFPEAPITLRDVENVYSNVKKAMNRGLPAIQAMIMKLGDEYQFHYALDDHDRLERVLFFHNESLQLLRLFPRSYVLDSTYSTNRFNLPLLDIVGFTATNRSFVIGQAFLTHEEEEDYIWVLNWIRDLYEEYSLPTPESITTDKAGGLHNACAAVWPEVPHLLCRWHIDKDVKAYCQKHWLERTNHLSNEARKAVIDERLKEFNGFWSQLLYAQTEDAYNRIWQTILQRYQYTQPKILSYLTRVWLSFKETFVQAWTDKIRHYGHVDSSRAEGVHRAIKRRMISKKAHLNDVVDHLTRYLDLHNRQLRQELEYDQQNERTDLQNPLYRKLHGHISYYAIDQIEEHRRFHNLTLKNAHLPLTACKQVFTTTKGLPCAHILQQRIQDHLALEIADFDAQWRIDRFQEIAELPPIRKIVDPLSVRTRYTKSQKRQLSLFEVIQGQVDSLSTAGSRKGRKWAKSTPFAAKVHSQEEQGESSRAGTAQQPISIDDIDIEEEEHYNSEEDPLGAELYRQRRQKATQPQPDLQIQGWIEYIPQQAKTYPPPSTLTRTVTPSPLYPPLPELRTPSPFASLDLPPFKTSPSLPSPSSMLNSRIQPPSLPPPSPPPPPPFLQTTVSPMTSPAKKRPCREKLRPQRYRNG